MESATPKEGWGTRYQIGVNLPKLTSIDEDWLWAAPGLRKGQTVSAETLLNEFYLWEGWEKREKNIPLSPFVERGCAIIDVCMSATSDT